MYHYDSVMLRLAAHSWVPRKSQNYDITEASSDRAPIPIKRIRADRMTCAGEVIHWIGVDGFQWHSQFRQRPHTDKMNSCGPNDVFQRGYSLDWDGPVSLGSVNSGPVPTGRALTQETSITRIQ